MRFLVFEHHPAEHPGRFRELMQRDGIAWDTVALHAGDAIPELASYEALLVFGGPMDVWQDAQHPWLRAEKAAIQHFVLELKRPYLGVCLGHQLLAAALGSDVGKMTRPDVGVSTVATTPAARADAIFNALPADFPALQWHGAEVKSLPPGGVALATSPACPIEAMRIGRHAWGIQYHVEIEHDTVADWNRITEYRAALQALRGADAQAALETAARANMLKFAQIASALHCGFCEAVRASR